MDSGFRFRENRWGPIYRKEERLTSPSAARTADVPSCTAPRDLRWSKPLVRQLHSVQFSLDRDSILEKIPLGIAATSVRSLPVTHVWTPPLIGRLS